MTHAECQDLLLDLAYGELAPDRAQDLSAHLAGCAECQAEKLSIDQARRMAAPLRELDEPSEGFDERVLQGARAQAQLDHGSMGQVIEVTGSVRPMGLEAAQIDAHAGPPRTQSRKPRWALRVALTGSVAAAAALALVVSTALSKRPSDAARIAAQPPLEIHVQPAPMQQAANEAVREAKEQAKDERAAQPSAAVAEKRAHAKAALDLAKKQAPAGGAAGLASRRLAGSGGDAAAPKEGKRLDAPAARDEEMQAEEAPPPPPPAASRPAPKAEPPAEGTARSAPQAVALAAAPTSAGSGSSGRVAAAAKQAPRALESDAQAPDTDAIERQAEEARHSGDYARAAALYREAATTLGSAGPSGARAAWDLAHAVECLAALGRFDEAKQVRAQLQQLYPSESSAFSAARRALREVDGAQALPARPAAKAKSEPAIPADF
jgi:putative zinc finger protein